MTSTNFKIGITEILTGIISGLVLWTVSVLLDIQGSVATLQAYQSLQDYRISQLEKIYAEDSSHPVSDSSSLPILEHN